MPTYEYECRGCGAAFERRQTMSDAPLRQCPECGGEVRRLVTGGAGFIIKSGRPSGGGRRDCSLERTGETCCGKGEPCGTPRCGSGS
jgi:putative FmdB family regulatory protein